MLGERELAARYGRIGTRMARLARGEDERAVNAGSLAHSISAETNLPEDTADATLAYTLWPLCERVSARLKQASLAGSGTKRCGSAAARRPPARGRCGAAKGIDEKQPRKWSAVRLNERLDVVQLSTDRVVAVVDQHVLRNSVVEKAHAELVLWLFDAGIRREESEPDAPTGPLQ